MPQRLRILALTLAFLLSAGCREAQQDTPSADTRNLSAGRLLYVCDWMPHPPRERRLLVDVILPRTDPPTRATEAELSALRSLGAEIRHVFWLPVVRVEIDRDRIPALVDNRLAVSIQTVADPELREIGVVIFFARPAREEDARRVEEWGGYVRWRPDPIQDGRPMMEAHVPDAAIPPIRAIPGVTHVRALAYTQCATPL